MNRLKYACLLLTLPIGCVSTTRQYVTRACGQEETVILESSRNLPSAMGDFTYESGVVKGRVGWTNDCRRAVVSKQIAEVVETKKPNRRAAVGAVVLGVAAGALSVALLSNAHTFSDEQYCSTDSEGHTSCSSPREWAYGWGAVGLLSSVAEFGAGIATFGMKSTTSVVDSQSAPPVVSRVLQENAQCGSNPIEGLGLSLLRAKQRVASSTTNAEGEVAFAVPPNVTGLLAVIVDAVPMPITTIHEGDVVGSVQVAPSEQAPEGHEPKASEVPLPGAPESKP
jgi:hypothetical protein